MLEIDVVTEESFDEKLNQFVVTSVRVRLEHSLVSASKWESLWKEAFLGRKDKTPQQTLSYVSCMVIDDELLPGVFQKLVVKHLDKIKDYIDDPMTATKLHSDPNSTASREVITTELIYYWMISMGIAMECQHWHLNRLITLIRVINLKNSPKKKMSAAERRSLNRSRLSQNNTRG